MTEDPGSEDTDDSASADLWQVGALLVDGELPDWRLMTLDALVTLADAQLIVVTPPDGRTLVTTALGRRPHRHIALDRSGTDGTWSEQDLAKLHGERLDVLLVFGLPDPPGALGTVARHGAWWLSHDRDVADRSELVVDGPPNVLRIELLAVDGGSHAPRVLRRGVFAVDRGDPRRTLARVRMGTTGWPAAVGRAIRAGLPADAGMTDPAPADVPGPVWASGSGVAFRVRGAASLGAARLRSWWRNAVRHEDWNIGVARIPVESLLRGAPLPAIDWAPRRQGRYAADPFGLLEQGVQVLFEDYAHRSGVATLARRSWSPGGWGPVKPELDTDSHLSYPFLLEHDGRRYLLPESRASGSLVLYGWDTSSAAWRPVSVVADRDDLSDATMLQDAGRWWLFAVRAAGPARNTELEIRFADRLEGPWREHPLNPVVVDVRHARPAGAIVRSRGELLRPAQDCSGGYGGRITVRRILELTPQRFREETVRTVDPPARGPYRHGLHTLNGVGDVTLLDGKRRVWSAAATRRVVAGHRAHRGRL